MPTRLDTWKSIAQHMGKSARTLQRWHKVYGLPVHHLTGEAGSVYAYGDELDAWLRGRSQAGLADLGAVTGTDHSPGGFDPATSLSSRRVFEPGLVPAPAKQRAAQLVALAARMWDSLSPRNLHRIASLYREAVDLDPENAAAYAGLSMSLITQGIWRLVHPPGAYSAAKAALHHALAIDPELPLAMCAGAWLKMILSRDWQGARNDFEEVLKQVPTCTPSMNGLALGYIAGGSLEKAAKLLAGSAAQSPLSSLGIALGIWVSYLNRKFKQALELAAEVRASGLDDPIPDVVEALASIQHYGPRASVERIEQLAAAAPGNEALKGALGYAYAVNGDGQKSRELLGPLMASTLDSMGKDPYAVALIWIGLNEKQKALKCIKQSFRVGSLWSFGFRSDPMLELLLSDPQCQPALNELDFPDFRGGTEAR